MRLQACPVGIQGFSLIETMMALSIVAFGLLAAGQLLYVAASSNALARSKESAALTAQSAMESLADLYRQNPSASEFSPGNHGPRSVTVVNPADGNPLNRYRIDWFVENVSDPRPGRHLNARLIRATVTPIREDGAANSQTGFSKILNLSTVFSQGIR